MRPNNGEPSRFLRPILWVGAALAAMVMIHERQDHPADPLDPTTRYEHRDVKTKAVAITFAGVLIGLWLAILAIYPFFAWLNRHVTRAGQGSATLHGFTLPPAPRLQPDPARDLQNLRGQEDAALNRYGWVDRAGGVVSIPIGRAIELVAQRGIPPQPAPKDMTYFDPHVGTRRTGFEGKVAPEPR